MVLLAIIVFCGVYWPLNPDPILDLIPYLSFSYTIFRPYVCPGLNYANEMHSLYNKHHKVSSLIKVTQTHIILSNMM